MTVFPPAPHGFYFKIRPSRSEAVRDVPDWAVVLKRKVWGLFPIEVGVGLTDRVTPDAINRAAEDAVADYEACLEWHRNNRARRAINRAERRSAK